MLELRATLERAEATAVLELRATLERDEVHLRRRERSWCQSRLPDRPVRAHERERAHVVDRQVRAHERVRLQGSRRRFMRGAGQR